MKTLRVVVGLASLALLASGCPKKPTDADKKAVTQPDEKKPAPGALAADADYAAGNVQAAVMEVETRLDVPGLAPDEKVDDVVKKAQAASVTTQTLSVSDNRGKAVFTTEGVFIPKGTELRYNPAQKKYVLADPGKKQYWAMSGSEIGNLLEGGPASVRTNYSIKITDSPDKETVAGFDAIRTDAELAFDWAVKTKSGDKKGKVKAKLSIWHSADAKLKAPWGAMMVDFLTVPFQDEKGQKVVDELKGKVKFPVKWAMEVVNEGQKGETPPKMVTTALKLEIRELPKPELATPPAGFEAATGPYEFGPDGQTAKEELLGKIPAKPGTPPKEEAK